MKKLALILFMGTLVSFYADAGRKPCSGSKGGISLDWPPESPDNQYHLNK
ncbi:hypothetical protein BvCmsKSP026_01273 [Escherichia coli]|nr:hypothetical protein BvCmsKSP026_01273 [Escherichia coli]